MLSGRGICDELITRPEESYRLWRVVVCDLETSITGRVWPNGALALWEKQNSINRNHETGDIHKVLLNKQNITHYGAVRNL